jgi:iron complex transport system substrate-binding protein
MAGLSNQLEVPNINTKKALTAIVIAVIIVSALSYVAMQQLSLNAQSQQATPTPQPTATLAPTNTPTPTATPTPSPTSQPNATATATPTPTPIPTATPSPTPTPTPTFPISVTDDTNTVITLTSYPNRIISLAPSTTEMLFSLGLQNKIVGVVSYSGYAQSVKDGITNQNITTVGTFNKVNTELVTGLQPDLIIASGSYQQSLAAKFAEQGQKTVILNPIKFSQILSDIKLLGKLTGTDANATALTSSMQSRADAVIAKVANLSRPGVYVEYYFDNTGYASYGADSHINELIGMAGGVNVFAGFKGQYVTTSTEEIVKAKPSIIVICNGVMSTMSGLTPDTLKARTGWSTISAVQNNQIYTINENLLTLWGPRIIDGLEALAKVIHPEVYPS